MPWYLYLALKQLFPTGRRFTVFTFVSLLGVGLAVWLLISTTGVMGGFGKKYGGMIVDTRGEIQVNVPAWRGAPREIEDKIRAVPGVTGVTPTFAGVAYLQYRDLPAFPSILGVDTSTIEQVVPIRKYLTGSLDELDDDSVILSAGIAQQVGAQIGSRVELYSPVMLQSIQRDEYKLATELIVVGIYEFGHQQLDASVVITTDRRMRDLYNLRTEMPMFYVKLAPGEDLFAAVGRIRAALPQEARPAVKTWIEAGESFLFALRLEKMMVTLMMGFVLVIAVFLVSALLWISVVRKTREIGLLGALGATPWQTAACFCLQGLLVGVFGTLLGLGLGFLTLANINSIFHFIGRLTGNWQAMVAIYQFTQVPAHITAPEVATIAGCSILLATLAGLIAAGRAARLKPVEALRSE